MGNWIEEIVGKNSIKNAVKDYDKDGVPNIIDCEPRNKNKQGLIHDIGAKALEKVGAKNKAEALRERGKRIDKEDKELRKIKDEERFKQKMETARYKERVAGEKQREYIKGGGAFGVIQRTFVTAQKPKRSYATKTKSKPKKRSYATKPSVPKVSNFLNYRF